jgi:hypothetical protein
MNGLDERLHNREGVRPPPGHDRSPRSTNLPFGEWE